MAGRRALAIPLVLAASIAWGLTLGVVHWRGGPSPLDAFEGALADLRFRIRGPRTPPDLVTVVAIDDDAAAAAGGYPLPRAKVAEIVGKIGAMRPKAIALDILFLDKGPEEGDLALSRALEASPSVIAAAAVFDAVKPQPAGTTSDVLAGAPRVARLLMPLPAFRAAAAVGVVNVATDATGTPRFLPMLLKVGEAVVVSLPLRAASIAAGEDPMVEPAALSLAGRRVPLGNGHALPIAFYGPRGTIRTVSAATVLAGQLDRAAVEGRIVVIGATVTGGGDVFPSPFDPLLPGVEVIATAIANVTAGEAMIRGTDVRLADAGLALALLLALLALLAWRRSAVAFAAMAGVVAVAAAIDMAAFSRGIWLSGALPMTVAGPPVLLFGAAQLWLRRRQSEHLTFQSQSLRRFQSPRVAEWLADDPAFLSEPVTQDAAVVFIDLSGFTGLSETLGPGVTRGLLKDFHELVDKAADGAGGLVTAFMGDGAMIVFGLPKPKPHDAARAAECCIALAEATRAWTRSLPDATAERIGFKIGAQFGPIAASMLGGGSHQHITAIGDTVNVASRLMEVAAAHGAEIALAEDLLEAAGRESGPPRTGVLDGPMETRIRGRSLPTRMWLWRPS